MGLLGGSFNPAHAGHLQVARTARRRLRLHQIWLLVSPGNPLKSSQGMAPLPARLRSAARIADGRRIIATTIEAALRTHYSVDTLRALRQRFPRVQFVWLAGADLLAQLPRWRRWTDFVRLAPFAVLPRPHYTFPALAGRAAHRLYRARRPARMAPCLPGLAPPAWLMIPAPENPISATALRAAGQGADQ